MHEENLVLLPGPTPVPERVKQAVNGSMINHRGDEFADLLFHVTESIKRMFKTQNEVLTVTSSGTGAMEAAVSNFISPGDQVVVAVAGGFGERFYKLACAFGAHPIRIEAPLGQAIEPNKIEKILATDTKQEIKAIFVTHNETTTGVYNDLEAISKARGNHPALLIVDSISGLGAMDVRTDEWDLDVVLTGSQKSFMMPPGLAMLSISPRAWEVAQNCSNSHFYFDLKNIKDFYGKGQVPFTPALSLYYGLEEALKMIEEEGRENIVNRHKLLRQMVRESMHALGLRLFAHEEVASPSLTTVMVPSYMDSSKLVERIKEYNVLFAGGQGELKGKIFRFGHLGYVKPMDIITAISALEMTLNELNYQVELGKGVRTAQEILLENRKQHAMKSQREIS